MQRFPIQPGKHLESQTPLTLLHSTQVFLHVFEQFFPKYPLWHAGLTKKMSKVKIKTQFLFLNLYYTIFEYFTQWFIVMCFVRYLKSICLNI